MGEDYPYVEFGLGGKGWTIVEVQEDYIVLKLEGKSTYIFPLSIFVLRYQ